MARPLDHERLDPMDAFDDEGSDIEPVEHLDAFDPLDPFAAPDAAATRSLDGLSVAGITRRRAAFALAALVTVWVVAVFARQVGDASAATARADRIRVENVEIAANVADLRSELQLIQTQPYIEQQARGYGLGNTRERPFALAGDAGPLPSDAPGSPGLRLGARTDARTPLESWLSVLFGPDPGAR
jgi:cell division protein FtsB